MATLSAAARPFSVNAPKRLSRTAAYAFTQGSLSSHPRDRRSFHLSGITSTIGDAVVHTASGISSLHSAGLPWYIAIPLVAAGVNFSIRLPVQYYARRLVLRRNELNPLVSAWASRHAATVPRGTGDKAEATQWIRVSGLTERSRRRIYKTWGVQRWKSLAPLTSMVPFIIVSESFRRLSGAPLGWISQSTGLANLGAVSSATTLHDPSLAAGGCLWFVDLTAMDPFYALPLLSSALLARASWGRLSRDQLRALLTPDASKVPRTAMTRTRTLIGRVLLLVPLFPLLLADLPSGLFLYWASTFALNDVNEFIMAKLLPKKKDGGLQVVRQRPQTFPWIQTSRMRGQNVENP